MKKIHLNCFMRVCPSLSKLIQRDLEVYICWFAQQTIQHQTASKLWFQIQWKSMLTSRSQFWLWLDYAPQEEQSNFCHLYLPAQVNKFHVQINFVSRKSTQIKKFLLQRWHTVLLGLAGCCRVILGALIGLLRVPWKKIQRLTSRNVTSWAHKHEFIR